MLNGNRTKSNRGRRPRDLYITPQDLANAAMYRFRVDKEFPEKYPLSALDAGCGTGIWGKSIAHLVNVYGIDLQLGIDKSNNDYDETIEGDFLQYDWGIKFDLIFGNPPYSLGEEFVRRSFELLETDGRIYFLFRLAFLEGIARAKGLFKEFPIKHIYVCSRRPSFFSTKGRHTTDTLAYSMFLWQKGYTGKTTLNFLDWEYSK